MLASILVGALLSAICVAIHTVGTTFWVQHLQRREGETQETLTTFQAMRLLCGTVVLLLLLHIAEVVVWAIAFLLIPDLPQIETLEEAVYFSMVTFASLGYGDIVIEGKWRLLSGIECMTGLLVFGWSTALLFAVVQRTWRALPAGK